MGNYQIARLTPAEFRLWDDYVLKHPRGSVPQTSMWLGRFPGDLHIQLARDEKGAIAGGVALLLTRPWGVRGFFKPPYTAYYGPLLTGSAKSRDAGARTEEMELVQNLLKALPRASHYDFMLPPGASDLLPYLWNGFQSSVWYTYILSGSYDQYLEGMVKRKRRNVRQAWDEVEAGSLSVSADAPLDDFFALLQQAREVTGLTVAEPALRRLLDFDRERKYWKLHLIKDREGRPAAASLVLCTEKRTTGLLSAVSNELRDNQNLANLLAYDAAIKWSLESGRSFDFCGSTIPGIERFLRYFGGEFTPRYRLQKSRSLLPFLARAFNRFPKERRPFNTYQ